MRWVGGVGWGSGAGGIICLAWRHGLPPSCVIPALTPAWITCLYRLYRRDKVAHLRKVRAGGVVEDQLFALRADLLRNLGNITNRCWVLGAGCRRDARGEAACERVFSAPLAHTLLPSPPHRTVPAPTLRSALHEHFPVIPEPIREYIEEVKAQLVEVTHSHGGCWCGWCRWAPVGGSSEEGDALVGAGCGGCTVCGEGSVDACHRHSSGCK